MRRFALISVTDKSGVVEFARGLCELGFTVLSTGGTFRALQAGGIGAVEVAAYTGFPELMDGRVKTLHPRVHGGILGRRGVDDDVAAEHGIEWIDVVAVNLYRFRETVAKPGVTDEEIVESIDIGGPAMIRSAAKNHASVVVVVDPADYWRALDAMRTGGEATARLAVELAGKAYAHTASYDQAVAAWFAGGDRWSVAGERVLELRYGENPHQQAALYADPDDPGPNLARARQRSGKELSYNNLADLDAALGLVLEFDEPACVIVKHNNPCGTATAERPDDAFRAALAGDPVSAFGGILAFNRALDATTARALALDGVFVEAIVAPSVEDAAMTVLAEAKWGANVRVLDLGGVPAAGAASWVRPISGGWLVQDADARAPVPELRAVTDRAPSDDEKRALDFAWQVCKHVKSNAIVLARCDGAVCATVGVGAGQMSRVDSVRIAVEKAGDRARGAVLASDAFFPFADGVEAALAAGVTAFAQPGGSRRDDEVVAAVNGVGASMVFTGKRHFRH